MRRRQKRTFESKYASFSLCPFECSCYIAECVRASVTAHLPSIIPIVSTCPCCVQSSPQLPLSSIVAPHASLTTSALSSGANAVSRFCRAHSSAGTHLWPPLRPPELYRSLLPCHVFSSMTAHRLYSSCLVGRAHSLLAAHSSFPFAGCPLPPLYPSECRRSSPSIYHPTLALTYGHPHDRCRCRCRISIMVPWRRSVPIGTGPRP